MSILLNNTTNNASLTRQHKLLRHSYTLVNEKATIHCKDKWRTPLICNNSGDWQVQSDDWQIQIENSIDDLVVEAAVSIIINSIHYAVLMASPSQLEYLALGFLFSEGLIEHRSDLLDWHISNIKDPVSLDEFLAENNYKANRTLETSSNIETFSINRMAEQLLTQLQDYDVYVIELTLNQRCHQRILAQRRQLAGRTGCGMCGMTGLVQALPDLSKYAKNYHNTIAQQPSLDELLILRQQVAQAQQTHNLTGAVHAAATLFEGRLQLFEDVGRHNALDKLIGWQLRHKAKLECVIITSRLSIELVQKSIRAPIPWLIGMSAPTSTAVQVARRYGLGLGGFLRDNRVSFYSGYNQQSSENSNLNTAL